MNKKITLTKLQKAILYVNSKFGYEARESLQCSDIVNFDIPIPSSIDGSMEYHPKQMDANLFIQLAISVGFNPNSQWKAVPGERVYIAGRGNGIIENQIYRKYMDDENDHVNGVNRDDVFENTPYGYLLACERAHNGDGKGKQTYEKFRGWEPVLCHTFYMVRGGNIFTVTYTGCPEHKTAVYENRAFPKTKDGKLAATQKVDDFIKEAKKAS